MTGPAADVSCVAASKVYFIVVLLLVTIAELLPHAPRAS